MFNKLAIVGGGPACLMIFKRLVESGQFNFSVDIFEATDTLGSGMPYSSQGSGVEHITNVSSDELPDLIMPLADWVKSLPESSLQPYCIDRRDVHEKKVMPRLLFGQYLKAQFRDLLGLAKQQGLETRVHYATPVVDICDSRPDSTILILTSAGDTFSFDRVIICSGHHWPGGPEGKVPGYFDSPYPPAKLAQCFDHTVAVLGSSLTAVDAIRTMARNNGRFEADQDSLVFEADAQSPNFRVVMHSRHGLLPCVRVHMDEPHIADKPLISDEDIVGNMEANGGFLQLDFLFETGFKKPLQQSDPVFYDQIKTMDLETFVKAMMAYRETIEPFSLLKKEYEESKRSIRNERPVCWKEMLASLSFAINYPAKYLSAEDMLRLQKLLMPLISVVIAFLPQSSCEELIALHEAGRLELIADENEGSVTVAEDGRIVYSWSPESGREEKVVYETFIDCTGQKHLPIDAFPFKSLIKDGTVSAARLKFRSADEAKKLLGQNKKHIEVIDGYFYLRVSGANISDNFQLVDCNGKASEKIYLMAVPYMAGFNPDYSGLDFCEHASDLIVNHILKSSIPKSDAAIRKRSLHSGSV